SSTVSIALPAGSGRLSLCLTDALLWLLWRRPPPFAPHLASPAPSVVPSADLMADRRKARKSASKARSGATLPQQLMLTGNMPTRGCPGLYKISVLINGTPKSSVTIKTVTENARVDFDLKTSPAKRVKHYVWVPARTGSHMGGGWVEVDSSGSAVAGTLNVDQDNAQAVQE